MSDWIEDHGSVVICGTDMEEVRRDSWGIKWCFRCRARHEFWFVVMAPVDKWSYYGPHGEIHGVKRGCTDLFPGWTREWEED